MTMKVSKLVFTLVFIVDILIVSSAAPIAEKSSYVNTENQNPRKTTTSLFLASHVRAPMTCERSPRVCREKNSRGPDCCNKKCVDVMTDLNNCGMCGRKCNFLEVCCDGGCFDASNDERHCGKCNNRCPNGSLCVYGMCSYA